MRDIRDAPIGVFDSGVGGLTVVGEIFRQMPAENLIYLGDTARYPYGPRSPEIVSRFALQNARFLMGFGIKTLIVACNTASSVAMETLRQWISIPMLDVISPGAKVAAATTKNKRIGVIGTEGTILSASYERAIGQINPEIQVFAQPCPLFVPLAEEGWLNGEVVEVIAHSYLDALTEAEIDTLVLGCTHYPLLQSAIQKTIGDDVEIVDSASAVVSELKNFLLSEDILRNGEVGQSKFFVTDAPKRFERIGAKFIKGRIIDVQHINLDA